MRRTSLDILEKSHLPGEQAKAILEVMDFELQTQREELVTKHEIAHEFALLRSEFKEQFFEMRKELHALELRIEALRAEMARWILSAALALIGTFGVMLGVFYFFANRLVK